ncbi:twin transmembrane helix small protein [Alkalicaulis satelles]|uniref:Twin transmembrane helix small protein n=1 Tax=Alkalicaulis satelles TaxID=2609175 RepID=A0A5M6ZGM1_9PROT|nr:twin transmembrane helix small protein [Alkalicaulis satelles]KAA5803912.1 twin transmembrane helix small protein [Alkalicaulis satelles]
MNTVLDLIVYGSIAIVFVILLAGIYALFRGGDFGRTWSNRLMRARVLFQFIAIVAVVGAVWAKQAFGL